MLADDLQKAKQREQSAAWDAGERRLAEQLTLDVLKPGLSADVLARVDIFARWCASKSARKCPAKPATVAAFLLDQAGLGFHPRHVVAMLTAIGAMHDHHSLSNPTATAIVRAALDQIVKVEPPRSWPKEERAAFALLPPDIRQSIAVRDAAADRAIKSKFNELAELKKRLLSGAEKPAPMNGKDYQHECTSQG